MAEELNKIAEEAKKTLHDLQERQEAISAEGKKTSDGVLELKNEFSKALEKVDSLAKSLADEEAARKALELVLARKNDADGVGTSSDPEYKAAFHEFLLSKGTKGIDQDTVFKELEYITKSAGPNAERLFNEMKTMYVGSNPDGGIFVPADRRTEMVTRIEELSPIRQLATVITTGRDMVEYPVDDDLTNNAVWVDELDARSASDTAKFALEQFPVHELYAEPSVTNKMMEDAGFDIEGFIVDKGVRDFAKAESTAFMLGDGAKRPRGLLTYGVTAVGTYARGKIGTKDTATNDTLAADDVVKFQYDLLEGYQANATWLMNRAIFATIATLKEASSGAYLLNPRILFEGVNPQLLGKPVVFCPDMASAVADQALVAAYGDFREGYLVVDRIGITILRDPYTDKRLVKFSMRKRVGGGVKNFQAFKILRIQ